MKEKKEIKEFNELENVIAQLNKKHGKDYVAYGAKFNYQDYKRRSFGIFALDVKTGGGLPEAKIATIGGKFSSGKTTLAICMAAQVQKKGGLVAWIDTDNGLDPIWAKKFGLDLEKVLISNPETIEQVSDTIEPLLMTGKFALIVFDSVAATPSTKELEASTDQKSMGGIAKEVGLMMRKIATRIKKTKTSILIINQLRDKIGGFGSAEYMPGGNQLKHQSDIMIFIRACDWIGAIEAPEGLTIKFRVSKNRTAPPLQTGKYDLLFDGIINNKKSILEAAVKFNYIHKAGSWFTYKEKRTQGLDNLSSELTLEDYKYLVTQILQQIKYPDINVNTDDKIESI